MTTGRPRGMLEPRQVQRLRAARKLRESAEERYDDVIRGVAEEGGTPAAIARELGVTRAAVSKRLHRAP